MFRTMPTLTKVQTQDNQQESIAKQNDKDQAKLTKLNHEGFTLTSVQELVWGDISGFQARMTPDQIARSFNVKKMNLQNTEGYQRDLHDQHVLNITRYILDSLKNDKTPYMLDQFIFNIPGEGIAQWQPWDNTLLFHEKGRMDTVDGQHRARGILKVEEQLMREKDPAFKSRLKEWLENYQIPVLIGNAWNDLQAAEIFYIFNGTSKPVAKSMLTTLRGQTGMGFKTPLEDRSYLVARELASHMESPFFGKISHTERAGKNTISIANLMKAIKERYQPTDVQAVYREIRDMYKEINRVFQNDPRLLQTHIFNGFMMTKDLLTIPGNIEQLYVKLGEVGLGHFKMMTGISKAPEVAALVRELLEGEMEEKEEEAG